MAETEIELTIKWQNRVVFEITAKENDGPVLIIAKHEENGELVTMWPGITDVIERYTRALMARIGKDMAKP